MEQSHHSGHTGSYDPGGFKKPYGKRHVTDYGTTMVQWMRHRQQRFRGGVRLEVERPSASYVVDMLPPGAKAYSAASCIPAKMLHSSLNKIKHPINVVKWTPEGRRLLTGSSSGEFTLWNGMAFNFETILQAHDSAVRAATYSHNEDWLVTADQDGTVKYWQTNFNNVKMIQAHLDAVRDIAFSPNDSKFVTASDDHTLNIFDFAAGAKESALTGHNWDVKACDWHPTKGLLVSGSKDHQIKLWDPRTSRCLTTLYGHKNTISKTKFEPQRGQLLATCARDQTARIFDLRMMRDVCLLRGNEKDISTLTWHPVHTSLLTTGGADGSIYHYLLDEPNTPAGTASTMPVYDSPDSSNVPAQTIFPAHKIPYAHDFSVWSLDWHPLGHILASGSNDRMTRFWIRPRPGEKDCYLDKFHLGEEEATAKGTYDRRGGRKMMHENEQQELEDEAEGLEDQKMPVKPAGLPGIPGLTMPLTNGGPINGAGSGSGPPLRGLPNGMLPPNLASGTGLPPAPFPPPIPPPGGLASIDFSHLPGMIGSAGGLPHPPLPYSFPPNPSGGPPPFPFPPAATGQDFVPPPPPSFPPVPPTNIAGATNSLYSIPGGVPGLAPSDGSAAPGTDAGFRKRGPLPSQQESLSMEQRSGRYRTAR